MLNQILNILQISNMVKRIKVIEHDEVDRDTFMFKIRANLPKNLMIQIRVVKDSDFIRYSYQLFSNIPILRWDNAEDYPNIRTYPHHFHDETGGVNSSELSGNPLEDIRIVLKRIEIYLQGRII